MNILIIDDEVNLRRSLAFTLRQAGFDCVEAQNGHVGCKLAKKESPDIILLDVRMPGMSGLDVLERLNGDLPDTPVIMMSAFDDTQDAVNAMKMGAADYLSKPFDIDELILLIKETNANRLLKSEVQYLRERYTQEATFIGNSSLIKTLRECLERISSSNIKTVLLLGETGVGKAVVARDLHVRGSGRESPFVEINCATLPENQIEAELFGAERGAIPGIISKRRGLVEIADGGTLFLDEIGEMPLNVQSKLLAFLETRSYRPLGIVREHHADVRVIAATNGNLEEAVENGSFRQDLYFRLKVMPIEIPPLREREKDIGLLSLHFAKKFSRDASCCSIEFSSAVREIFYTYNWPGNVRELKNLIERLTILYPGQKIIEEQLPSEMRNLSRKKPHTIEESLISIERGLVQDALIKCRGKKGLAAERLGISRHALKRRMQKLELS
ncbi:MAG: sigma-54 dependent transcriptional regulator [Proteobacteria bacterium]|nr:sigma-54 dependent transcriptional regulator [Pseudomonadota bacterium]